jgi:molecular chaperone DnaJ
MDNVTMVQLECDDCEGMGVTVPACLSCSGMGSVRSKVTETMKIPAGVYSGLVLRSQGKGNQMKKGTGQPGDLLLKVTVEDHAVFKRDAENITSEAHIPFTKAVFGGPVQVKSLKGTSEIKV